MKQIVCKKDELLPGGMIEATLGRVSIVVCRTTDGNFYAFANRCIHQGAPMSKGKICGAPAPTDTPGQYHYVREGEILRCPWHGREYDIKDGGRMLADPSLQLRDFKVWVEGDEVLVQRN
jgi:nitrite reductase/ring-hydroxylating ferredoxin subunit